MTKLPIESLKKPELAKLKPFGLKSIGSRLFLAVLGGAMLGLGTVGYFSYQSSEKQDEIVIAGNLEKAVKDLDAQLQTGQSFLNSMASSIIFLSTNKNLPPNDYKRFLISQMPARPSLVTGFGVMQTPKGLVQERQWFSPYIFEYTGDAIAHVKNGKAERLTKPYEQFAYGDLLVIDEYFKQDYYKDTVKETTPVWTEPYITSDAFLLTTYGGAIKDSQGKVIGAFNGDVSLKDLVSALNGKSVLRQTGYFALLSSQGNVLAYPSQGEKVELLSSAEKNPKLKAIWTQIQKNSSKQPTGIIKLDNSSEYWAYQRVPSSNWVLLAAVPYSTVTNIALQNTLTGIAVVAMILAVVVFVFGRYLNRRLRPILDECNSIAGADDLMLAKLKQQDEVGQVSVAFFNLIDQLGEKERQIREETARAVQQQAELTLAAQQQEESEALQQDVEKLLEVVSAVENGDLTIQAPVSDRVTGLVSDTFNRLIEELNRVMSTVSTTAQQVTGSATDLEQLAMQSSHQAKQQTQAVDRIKVLVQDVTELTQDNTAQTSEADAAVQQAQNAVNLGQQQMNLLNEEIESLQGGTTQITRRVQTLTEFVQLAVQFVKAQKRTASMTRVLALNASLLSSRAMEQQDPEQFASIAREFETITSQVNDLANQTNQDLVILQQRTDQIQAVVSGLSEDVREINQVVQVFTAGVDESNQVFENIQSVTSRVVQVGQRVAESSFVIAQVSQTTLTSVQDIAALAMATEQRADITREQSSAMGQISRELLEIMSFFKISAEEMQVSQSSFDRPDRVNNLIEPTLSRIG
ncbi:methyl-accepting chemotaxis protein [Merismopedia glauca]|uniref:Methyl-accepting chemotaxis protein n=1 Tax=Merismopedia glauca CCAP 1448/3 TaxID=1296344 RepID=A0A2T1C717_9CYAN|nr:methyl-accepting chemotaxis protein [Merismopedia glauca]PSB04072.1 hypothetical protein C7B64_05390 [Merismopedia glauca CCAP 1448/3]